MIVSTEKNSRVLVLILVLTSLLPFDSFHTLYQYTVVEDVRRKSSFYTIQNPSENLSDEKDENN